MVNFFTSRWRFMIGTIVSGLLVIVVTCLDSKTITETALGLIGLFLSISIDAYYRRKDKEKQEALEAENHFPKSYPIIKENILHVINEKSKVQLSTAINNDKEIDKTITSPLEYIHETLIGNPAPDFNPNAPYLEEIYSKDVKCIVAITAENPNLWLDPTLCFYMTNCCAVSLMNHANKNVGKEIEVKDFNTGLEYSTFVETKYVPILQKLERKIDLIDFEFIRFLIFTERQRECLEKTVFPSLKAIQDLFRIKSFFIQKDKLQNNLGNEYSLYRVCVETIWQRIVSHNNITDEEILKIVNDRKDNLIPEFLFLFKNNGNIVIHTYIKGEPYCAPLHDNVSHVEGNENVIRNLIAYLAKCRLKNEKCDWVPSGENLNTKKSYIDWC